MATKIYNKSSQPRKKAAAKPITSTPATGRRVKLLKVAKPTNGSEPPATTKVKKAVKPRKATIPPKKSRPVTPPKKKAGIITPKSTAKRLAIPTATVTKHRVVSTTKKSVKFSLDAPTGSNLAVSGSFNSWIPQAMTKGQDGSWSVTLELVPGVYPYRFLVDSERIDDPNNLRKTVDPLQGFCSVCEVL